MSSFWRNGAGNAESWERKAESGEPERGLTGSADFSPVYETRIPPHCTCVSVFSGDPTLRAPQIGRYTLRSAAERSVSLHVPGLLLPRRRTLWSSCVCVRTSRLAMRSSGFVSWWSMPGSRRKCAAASITRSPARRPADPVVAPNAAPGSSAWYPAANAAGSRLSSAVDSHRPVHRPVAICGCCKVVLRLRASVLILIR